MYYAVREGSGSDLESLPKGGLYTDFRTHKKRTILVLFVLLSLLVNRRLFLFLFLFFFFVRFTDRKVKRDHAACDANHNGHAGREKRVAIFECYFFS